MVGCRFDVLTMGNAIVDIISPIEPRFLSAEGMKKGIMHLVDGNRAADLYQKMPRNKRQISGGSAANTAVGVASLGGRASFIGKVAADEHGDFFVQELSQIGVHFETRRLGGGEPTARSLVFLTPDGERTMNTHLGACHCLTVADIDEEHIRGSRIILMEGFLWDSPDARDAFLASARYAQKHGRTVAFSLSDPLCVLRYRDEFMGLIRSGNVDILISNAHELAALCQTGNLAEAIRTIQDDVKLAAVTLGADGAIGVAKGEEISVSAYPVTNVIDTTGAGDLFAAGFLFAIATGRTLVTALRMGCLSASEVISHIGARPEINLADLIEQHGFCLPPLLPSGSDSTSS